MKRLKRVVSNAEVFHLFANQREADFADNARNANDSCSFNGRRAYSYNAVIATYTDVPKAKKSDFREQAVLINESYASYSNTTSRHISLLEYAISDSTLSFKVPKVEFSGDYGKNSGRPEKVLNEDDIRNHLINISYLQNGAVRASFSEHRNYTDEKAVRNWLEYVKVFKLRRLLTKIEKNIFDWWLNNAGKDSTSKGYLSRFLGPFSLHRLTSEEQQVIKEFADEAKTKLTDVFRSHWGFGRTPEELENFTVTSEQFNSRVIQRRIEKGKADAIRRICSNGGRVNRQNRPAKDIIEGWLTDTPLNVDNGQWYSSSISSVSPNDMLAYYGYDADHSMIFNRSPLGNLNHRRPSIKLLRFNEVTQKVTKPLITSGGVRIPVREFKLYWKNFIRPIWNYRHHPDLFKFISKLFKYNADNKISQAFKVDNVYIRAGIFKIGCHDMLFNNLADCAKKAGFENNCLRWNPICLAAPVNTDAIAESFRSHADAV